MGKPLMTTEATMNIQTATTATTYRVICAHSDDTVDLIVPPLNAPAITHDRAETKAAVYCCSRIVTDTEARELAARDNYTDQPTATDAPPATHSHEGPCQPYCGPHMDGYLAESVYGAMVRRRKENAATV